MPEPLPVTVVSDQLGKATLNFPLPNEWLIRAVLQRCQGQSQRWREMLEAMLRQGMQEGHSR